MYNYYNNRSILSKFYKFIPLLIVIIFALILFLLIDIDGQDKGKKIAVINGVSIFESDISERINYLTKRNQIEIEEIPEEILRAVVLESAINKKIDAEAKRLKYHKNKDIKAEVERYKNNLVREKYLNDNIYMNISEEDVKKEYKNLINTLIGQEERRIKHILLNTEEEAERVRRTVMRSGNFEKVAREKSIDKASGAEGGDLGYALRDDLVPEFANVAFILKQNEISKPVKTSYGWHIIKVEDIRTAQFLPYEDAKGAIRAKLQQDAIQKYLSEEVKEADIDYKITFKKPKSFNNKQSKTNKDKDVKENNNTKNENNTSDKNTNTEIDINNNEKTTK